jgi:plasmid stabilization system protein ParE
MKQIVWSDPSISDLDSIHQYIARDSELYADAVIFDILESAEHLRDYHRIDRMKES